MFEIHSINHVSLLVADTARALKFYQGVLGLEVDDSRPEFAFPGAWLKVGERQIHLIELPRPGEPVDPALHGGHDNHLALNVRGLDEIAAALDAVGVSCTRSRSGRAALFCRDPDRNALEMVESAAVDP